MFATFITARDDMYAVLRAAWTGGDATIAWPDVPFEIPTTEIAWVRVKLIHATGNQATLSGGNGVQRYTRKGTLWAQVFAPLGDGGTQCYTLAETLVKAFEGVSTPNGVWFRNQRLNEIGESGAFTQNNVLIDFTYDELK
jgi:hypothetical protein